MLLGAIDIGSNAMRFLVSSATFYDNSWQIQRVEYLRYPIRLGEDVFTTGHIGQEKVKKLSKMLDAFKTMFDVFDVAAYRVCATSAMRDAANGSEVIEHVKQQCGITIDTLSGTTEAGLIDKALHLIVQSGLYVHVDVGGGSTEINIIQNGVKLASQSFNIGTVRAVHNTIEATTWEDMRMWVVSQIRDAKLGVPVCIGTGGNIKKLHELSGLSPEMLLPIGRLEQLRNTLKSMTIPERMRILKLNEDRADVIVPAGDIYLNIMQWAGANEIMAPNIGLIDGIIAQLFESVPH